MKRICLVVIFLLISSLSFSFLVSDEKKIGIAIEKYQFGYYDECILILNKFTDAGWFSKNPLEASDAFALKAASHFRLAEHSSYEKSVSEWVNFSSGNLPDSVKLICNFKIAQLFLEVGNVKGCDSILALLPKNLNNEFSYSFNLVKAGLLLKKGEISESGKILLQLSQQKEILKSGNKKNLYLSFFDNSRKIYMDIVFRRIESAITKGEIDSATNLISVHRSWLAQNLPSHYYSRELYRLTGDMELSRNNIRKAYEAYKKAYQYESFPDLDCRKIELLASLIALSDKLDLSDQSQKLLRRLQMQAYIRSGKQEPFQFVYERTLIQIEIFKNNFSGAKERIRRFTNNYRHLPSWHPVKLSFAKLESDILLYKSGLNISSRLDSLILVSQENLGESHEYVARLLVEKISYDIHFGSTLKDVERDLGKFNKLFIEKGYAGIYLLQYYELSSIYYSLLDNFKSSREYSEKAYNYSLRLYGKESEKIIYHHGNYSKSLLQAGAYKEFATQFEQLKKTFSSIAWTDIEEKRKSYIAISSILKITGEKDESKNTLIKILNEMEEVGKENIYARSKTESQLAYIFYKAGNLFKAEKLIKKSLKEKESLFPLNSSAFIEDLFFIGELELQKGNFNDAEKNLEKASEIISNLYGKNSLLYSEYLKLHADYCIAIGDYKRGDDFIAKAQKIVVEKVGKKDLSNVSILVRKAFILSQNDPENMDKKNISSLYSESLSILSATIGKENVLYMDVLKRNAYFLLKINKLNSADSLLTVVENYWKNRLGQVNSELLEVYLLKGDIAYEKSNYEMANSHYTTVKTIACSIYDNKNTFYTRAYARQAKVAYMQNKPEEALNIMEILLPQYMKFVSKNFPALSFREKAKYWNNMKDEFEFYVFLVLSNKGFTAKYSKEVYNNVIATKAILLSNSIKIRESIMASKDTLLIQAYNEWIDLKEYYTSVSSLTKAELEEQKIDLRSIEADIDKKEKNLSNRSELFKAEDKISNAAFKDIAAILSEDEFAVELVRYRNFYKHFTDTINYAALIIHKSADAPEVVVFPKGNSFESTGLKYARNAARYHLKDRNSYGLFWAPLQSRLPQGSTVYLSSEGAFNQFNIEMLADSAGKYILEKIELVQVTNTKELLRMVYQSDRQKTQMNSSEVVLAGNPDFYEKENSGYAVKVSDLPGAAKEVEDLSVLLATNKMNVSKVMGTELSEERVKSLNSPKVFHIATHGYYNKVKNIEDDNNAMLNSGLLLKDAGDIIGTESHVNSRDGILTAYEAMNLKLDNTDLVVLSACETGLGEVQAGEGVYGLQRSFLIAGSKAIIISLYKVNDEVTQKLMMEFYTQWIATGDIRKSFINAKQKIKSEYPDVPIYWGAFVLIEGQPQLKRKTSKKA